MRALEYSRVPGVSIYFTKKSKKFGAPARAAADVARFEGRAVLPVLPQPLIQIRAPDHDPTPAIRFQLTRIDPFLQHMHWHSSERRGFDEFKAWTTEWLCQQSFYR